MLGGIFQISAEDKGSDVWIKEPLPSGWTLDSISQNQLPSTDNWWRSLGDPTLITLINMAEDNNYDLRAAVKRIEASRQTLNSARSGYFPTIGLQAGWTKEQSSGSESKETYKPYPDTYFNFGLNASWEVDLFGRIKEKTKGLTANLNVSKADYNSAMISVCSQMATNYIVLRTYQEQLEVAMDHIDSQERVVNLTKARFEAGLVSQLDVLQAQMVLQSTKALVPGLKKSISITLNAIATLCGIYPDQLPSEVRVHGSIPESSAFTELGVPADMIRRRPDIIEAQYNLEVLASQVGIAKKDYLPSLTINGSISSSSHKLNGLFTENSLNYSISPQLSWTVFDGLDRKYAVAEAKANLQAAVDSYNQTVISAIQDVNNCLLRYDSLNEEIELDKEVCDVSFKTLDLAVERYKLGLSDFTNVANAQMSVLTNINSLISARSNALTTLVSLYKALGGGWEVPAVSE